MKTKKDEIEALVEQIRDIGKLEQCLNTLSDRERRVIKMRLGLDDGNSMTLDQIGEEFGVTRERIRQIEKKAHRRLQARYRKFADLKSG